MDFGRDQRKPNCFKKKRRRKGRGGRREIGGKEGTKKEPEENKCQSLESGREEKGKGKR